MRCKAAAHYDERIVNVRIAQQIVERAAGKTEKARAAGSSHFASSACSFFFSPKPPIDFAQSSPSVVGSARIAMLERHDECSAATTGMRAAIVVGNMSGSMAERQLSRDNTETDSLQKLTCGLGRQQSRYGSQRGEMMLSSGWSEGSPFPEG
tara:strand:- start:1494 stop:1949 length:456 start_codon:yes stop_codon:yes gene_type:complete